MIFQLFIINFFIAVTTTATINGINYLTYEDARKSIKKSENGFITAHIGLNDQELRVNDIFMKYKNDELKAGFQDPEYNAAGKHFFKAKQLIDRSKVFKFLQKMPKGANLHMHTSASVSSEWVVKNIFYMPGLLKCKNKEGVDILTFQAQPEKHGCATEYERISNKRRRSGSSEEYDKAIETIINLYTPNPEIEYNTTNRVWRKFQNMFTSMSDVLHFLPAYRAYHWQMLEELYNDNVMYAEVRLNFKELYDIKGRTYPPTETVGVLIAVIEQFKQKRPKFLGLKMIFAVHRNADSDKIRQRFEEYKILQHLYPDYIIGFDLVGQEDVGRPLYDFVHIFKNKPSINKFFFHAGETNWYGGYTDDNLLDAILLNTTRIGHGFSLLKHPDLSHEVKNRGIAIEVCPLSNQVLHLVSDLRNHPGAFFMSQDFPIVISNDDPGFWNAKGLSYDFYYAIMSLAPNNEGLKMLKQLVWNSIRYSTLTQSESIRAVEMWKLQWDEFINDVLNGLEV